MIGDFDNDEHAQVPIVKVRKVDSRSMTMTFLDGGTAKFL
jgi:hypothetical protein